MDDSHPAILGAASLQLDRERQSLQHFAHQRREFNFSIASSVGCEQQRHLLRQPNAVLLDNQFKQLSDIVFLGQFVHLGNFAWIELVVHYRQNALHSLLSVGLRCRGPQGLGGPVPRLIEGDTILVANGQVEEVLATLVLLEECISAGDVVNVAHRQSFANQLAESKRLGSHGSGREVSVVYAVVAGLQLGDENRHILLVDPVADNRVHVDQPGGLVDHKNIS